MKITNKKKIGTEKKEAEKYDLEEIKIDPAGKREFYIVDKRILPNSIQSVIKVNDLVQHSKMSKYEAIKKVGIVEVLTTNIKIISNHFLKVEKIRYSVFICHL